MDAASVLLVVSALYAFAMFVLRMASNSLQGALDTLLSIQKILLELKHDDIPKDRYQHLLDQYEGISRNIRDISDRINKDGNLFNVIRKIKQMRASTKMNEDVQQFFQVVKLSVIDSGILAQRKRMLAIAAAHDSDHVDDTENECSSTPGDRKGSVPDICKCMHDDVGDIESQCTLRKAQIRDRGQPMKCHHRVRHTARRVIRNVLSLQPQTKYSCHNLPQAGM
ncbi:hypothetical protein BC629DRAFT_230937 [Irpex lacteus]|nr:hypothetical protein BC629DRAFT_230937 [Irpex lacteus]